MECPECKTEIKLRKSFDQPEFVHHHYKCTNCGMKWGIIEYKELADG